MAWAVAALTIGGGGDALAAPGDLDPNYGSAGRAIVDVERKDIAPELALDSSGRPLVAFWAGDFGDCGGFLCNERLQRTFVRLLPGGSLDRSFGAGGLLGVGGTGYGGPSGFVLQSSDVMVAGISGLAHTGVAPDGTVRWEENLCHELQHCSQYSLAADDQDRLLVGGEISSTNRIVVEFWVGRRLPDGSPDPDFADGGDLVHRFGLHSEVRKLFPQPGGALIAIGEWQENPYVAGLSEERPFMARLTDAGELDESFGESGIAIPEPPRHVEGRLGAVTEHRDGYLLSIGSHLVRIDGQGDVDDTFGDGGATEIPIPRVVAMVPIPGGDIMIVGKGSRLDAWTLLSRVGADGRIDRDLGRDGLVHTPSLTPFDAIHTDGRLLVAGARYRGERIDLEFARYLLDGGPGDADVDGLLDERDKCQFLYAHHRSGCPRVRWRVADVTYYSGVRIVSGYVRYRRGGIPGGPCRRNRVVLWRKADGKPRRVVRTTHLKRGVTFRFKFPRRPGRYHVQVKRRLDPDAGRCPSIRSKKFPIRPNA